MKKKITIISIGTIFFFLLIASCATAFPIQKKQGQTINEELGNGFIRAHFNYLSNEHVTYNKGLIKTNVKITAGSGRENLGFLIINGKTVYSYVDDCVLTIDVLVGRITLLPGPFWDCKIHGFARGIHFEII